MAKPERKRQRRSSNLSERLGSRTSNACQACKKRKTKCSGVPGPCDACDKAETYCNFNLKLDTRRRECHRPSEIQERQRYLLEGLLQTLKHNNGADIDDLIHMLRTQSQPELVATCLRKHFLALEERGLLTSVDIDDTDIITLGLQNLYGHRSHRSKPSTSIQIKPDPDDQSDEDSLSANGSTSSDEPMSFPSDFTNTSSPELVAGNSSSSKGPESDESLDATHEPDHLGSPILIDTDLDTEVQNILDGAAYRSLQEESYDMPLPASQNIVNPGHNLTSRVNPPQTFQRPSHATQAPSSFHNQNTMPINFQTDPRGRWGQLNSTQAPHLDPVNNFFTDYNPGNADILASSSLPTCYLSIESLPRSGPPHTSSPSHIHPYSQAVFAFRETAWRMMANGQSASRIFDPGVVDAELLFRPRIPSDSFNAANWASELVRTFPPVEPAVRLSTVLCLVRMIKYVIIPSVANLAELPGILRPLDVQVRRAHEMIVDFLPLPGLRAQLCQQPQEYWELLEDFGLSLNWKGAMGDVGGADVTYEGGWGTERQRRGGISFQSNDAMRKTMEEVQQQKKQNDHAADFHFDPRSTNLGTTVTSRTSSSNSNISSSTAASDPHSNSSSLSSSSSIPTITHTLQHPAIFRDPLTGRRTISKEFEDHAFRYENWSFKSRVLDMWPSLRGQVRIEG